MSADDLSFLVVYFGLLRTLDLTTRAGFRSWARIALQARREALKLGQVGHADYLRDRAIYAWRRAREIARQRPFDAGRFRVDLTRAGAPVVAVERCLDAARRETCAASPAFGGQRGAA